MPVVLPDEPLTLPVTFPVRDAVIVPAAKFPEPSRATIALAVFAEAAVVLLFASMPVTPLAKSTGEGANGLQVFVAEHT